MLAFGPVSPTASTGSRLPADGRSPCARRTLGASTPHGGDPSSAFHQLHLRPCFQVIKTAAAIDSAQTVGSPCVGHGSPCPGSSVPTSCGLRVSGGDRRPSPHDVSVWERRGQWRAGKARGMSLRVHVGVLPSHVAVSGDTLTFGQRLAGGEGVSHAGDGGDEFQAGEQRVRGVQEKTQRVCPRRFLMLFSAGWTQPAGGVLVPAAT